MVHEQAHQWFGDDVAVRRWRDIWLNEGFATYAEWAWAEHLGATSGRRPGWTASTTSARPPSAFWDLRVSDPGAARMFALGHLRARRDDAGRAAQPGRRPPSFDDASRGPGCERNAGGHGTGAEFRALAEEVCGEDLDGFFTSGSTTPTSPPAPRRTDWHERLARPAAYAATHARSIEDPEGFWLEQAGLVDWFAKPTRALDDSRPPFYRWFPDATLNTCYNALDRHVVNGRADQPALVHDSPVTGTRATYTYAQLLEQVAAFAGALRALGVEKGDRVIVYMPMIPEAVIAMLACARLGAVHSVVFGGFAANELAARIDDARPKVVVAASCGVEPSRVVEYKPLLDRALELAEHAAVGRGRQAAAAGRGDDGRGARPRLGPRHEARPERPRGRASRSPPPTRSTCSTPPGPPASRRASCATTAGTPSRWPGRCRTSTTSAPGQVCWAASDVGWVVGHSYIVYAPLICGATTVLYEGKPVGTPDAGAFWRVVADHKVEALFTAPTAIRAVKKEDPEARLLADHDISSLRTLFLAGERLDPDTYTWATERLGVPVVDNWWQTETGWPIVANLRGLEPMPIKPGSPTVPVPGYDVQVLDPTGQQVAAGEEGAICLKLPLPPGTLPTLWGDDERFVSSYLATFDGYYMSGDGGYVDEDGYVFVMGRTDDVINVAGHRLSTGSMEAVIASHPAVAECAVIGVADPTKGQVPRGFVVLKSGVDDEPDEIARELVAMVRDEVGPVAAFRDVAVVPALPKTRSGKILRKTMREIADGKDAQPPSTIEDPAVLDTLRPSLRSTPS